MGFYQGGIFPVRGMSRFLAWGWGDGAIECFSLIFYFSFVLYEREPWVSLQLLFLDLKISIFMILISNLALNCPLQNFLSISLSSSFNQLCTSCLKEKTQTKPDINCLFRLFMVINQQFKHFVKLGRFVFNCCSVLMWFYQIVNFTGVSGDSGYHFWSCFPKNT